jgi:hypothetical protein
MISSADVEEHERHIQLVMEALAKAKLYCNAKKCEFFVTKLNFLGHHISAWGVEADGSKVDKILEWPVPTSATDVRSFLGLVRYIAVYLPKLAEWTRVLTPLTTKDAKKKFPEWGADHQEAFEQIKQTVISWECLTVINHDDMKDNRIFVTCDASDWRTGAMLSFGPDWESARLVAFDSMQLKGAEKNYPVHEKELLAVVRALKKWRADLMGVPFEVYTHHRTLENFNTQRDLSRRQLRWQEYMSQYDMSLIYMQGADNTVADALSRLPPEVFQGESKEQKDQNGVNVVLRVSAEESFLRAIKQGYTTDEFCQKVVANPMTLPNIREQDGIWYVGERMLIPRVGNIREDLFAMAHDTAGHFGVDKSYAALRDSYYWPNMRRDLEKSYIPSCVECQWNKSRTTKSSSPLHPLPVPDQRGDSVALNFIGPLPPDEGYDSILSIMDRLNSDIRMVPTRCDISATDLAVLFFDHWYCENGLPLELISDRDKLFVLEFWKALHKLTGVKLKIVTVRVPRFDHDSKAASTTIREDESELNRHLL